MCAWFELHAAPKRRKYHENSGRADSIIGRDLRPDTLSRMSDEMPGRLEPIVADPVDITLPAADSVAAPAVSRARPPHWIFALMQSIAVCGIPTQVVIAVVLFFIVGMAPMDGNGLSLEFIATVSFLDTALVAILIRVFLALSRE